MVGAEERFGDLGDGVLVTLAGGSDGVLGAEDLVEGRALRDAQQLQRAFHRHLEGRRRRVVGARRRQAPRRSPAARGAGRGAAPRHGGGGGPAEEGPAAAAAAAAAEGEGRGHFSLAALASSLGVGLWCPRMPAALRFFLFKFSDTILGYVL